MIYKVESKERSKDEINKALDLYYKLKNNPDSVSDGYHTFGELYHHRAVLFATICNQNKSIAWKSKQHNDPKFPMYDGMFICGINTPYGQVTYHYNIDPYWDMFKVIELACAPEYDGHTPTDAINRMQKFSENMN